MHSESLPDPGQRESFWAKLRGTSQRIWHRQILMQTLLKLYVSVPWTSLRVRAGKSWTSTTLAYRDRPSIALVLLLLASRASSMLASVAGLLLESLLLCSLLPLAVRPATYARSGRRLPSLGKESFTSPLRSPPAASADGTTQPLPDYGAANSSRRSRRSRRRGKR